MSSKFPATQALVIANVAVFLAMAAASFGQSLTTPSSEMLLAWGANFAPLTFGGQWWRMFSSMFLHIGFMHIAFNMAALWNMGQDTETLFGTKRFLNLYMISGFAGSCFSLFFNPGVVSAGASGAIFGVYGAFLGFFVSFKEEIGKEAFMSITKSAAGFLALNLILGVTMGFDNFCHLGGLLAGFLCGLIYLPRPKTVFAKHPVIGTAMLIGTICGLFQYAKTVPFDLGGHYAITSAAELIDKKQYAEADKILVSALKKSPDNAYFHYLHGIVLGNTAHLEEALGEINRAIYLDSKLEDAVRVRDEIKARLSQSPASK